MNHSNFYLSRLLLAILLEMQQFLITILKLFPLKLLKKNLNKYSDKMYVDAIIGGVTAKFID